jgi:protease YdgD
VTRRRARCAAAGAAVIAGLLSTTAAAAETASPAPREDAVMLDASAYPWSAVGRLNGVPGGFCSGALIGRRLVLTAAHCLYNTRTRHWSQADRIHFLPGYARGDVSVQSPVRDYRVAAGYDPSTATVAGEARDWAVLRLVDALGDRAGYLGWLALDATTLATLKRERAIVAAAGYRRNRPHLMSLRARCALIGFAPDSPLLLHGCASIPGESGEPLLALHDDAFAVVAVNVGRLTTRSGTFGVAVPARDYANALAGVGFDPALGPDDWGPPADTVARRHAAALEQARRLVEQGAARGR